MATETQSTETQEASTASEATKAFLVPLPEFLHEALRKEALKQGVSMREMAILCIAKSLTPDAVVNRPKLLPRAGK